MCERHETLDMAIKTESCCAMRAHTERIAGTKTDVATGPLRPIATARHATTGRTHNNSTVVKTVTAECAVLFALGSAGRCPDQHQLLLRLPRRT